jgi:hypothetical protein
MPHNSTLRPRAFYAWAGAALAIAAAESKTLIAWPPTPLPMAATLSLTLLKPIERSCLLQGASHALLVDVLLLESLSQVMLT